MACILLYHRVAQTSRDVHQLAVTPEGFRSQMEMLRRRWCVMPLSGLVADAAAGAVAADAVAVTFDDGYLDNLDAAAPLLAELGLPATFFLTAESPDHPREYWWDGLESLLLGDGPLPESLDLMASNRRHRWSLATTADRYRTHADLYALLKRATTPARNALLRQLPRGAGAGVTGRAGERRPMLAHEVQRLAAFPLVEVGAHSVHHVSLSAVPIGELGGEIAGSRAILERVVGRPVTAFAYPYGDTAPAAIAAVQKAGFTVAVCCEQRPLRPSDDRLCLPRLGTRDEDGEALHARLVAARGATR